MTRFATPLRAAAAALALLALAGCSGVPIDKRTQGQVLGGVTGAAVGSLFGGGSGQIVATGVTCSTPIHFAHGAEYRSWSHKRDVRSPSSAVVSPA